MTRDTVIGETPTFFATSRIVTLTEVCYSKFLETDTDTTSILNFVPVFEMKLTKYCTQIMLAVTDSPDL